MGFFKNLLRSLLARDRLYVIRTVNENRLPFTLIGRDEFPDRVTDDMHAALARDDETEPANPLGDAEFGADTPAVIQAQREASISRERERRRRRRT
jgi:hypothetical protein